MITKEKQNGIFDFNIVCFILCKKIRKKNETILKQVANKVILDNYFRYFLKTYITTKTIIKTAILYSPKVLSN